MFSFSFRSHNILSIGISWNIVTGTCLPSLVTGWKGSNYGIRPVKANNHQNCWHFLLSVTLLKENVGATYWYSHNFLSSCNFFFYYFQSKLEYLTFQNIHHVSDLHKRKYFHYAVRWIRELVPVTTIKKSPPLLAFKPHSENVLVGWANCRAKMRQWAGFSLSPVHVWNIFRINQKQRGATFKIKTKKKEDSRLFFFSIINLRKLSMISRTR